MKTLDQLTLPFVKLNNEHGKLLAFADTKTLLWYNNRLAWLITYTGRDYAIFRYKNDKKHIKIPIEKARNIWKKGKLR